jgi:crossover junction endodeoxyribonuclease RusA
MIAKSAAREQSWVYSRGEKLVIELWAFWADGKKRDIHNLHKILCDCLEGILYENDSWVLVRDIDFCVDKRNPRVEIRIWRASDE